MIPLPTRDLVIAALFAALISMGALVSIPMVGPVPLTFQVFFVLLSGLVLGARLGALSVGVYLVVGLVAPVYAQGSSGLGALAGPAGGYLIGFVLASYLVGALAQRFRPGALVGLAATALTGLLPIYVLGASWLAWSLGTFNLHTVLWAGIAQFVPGDVAKVLLAAVAARALLSLPLGLPVIARSH